MSSTESTQDKRQQLIDCAYQLFYQRGIQAVGINEILKASGIAKKTLYHHFASKDELVLAALEQRHQRWIRWFASQLTASNQAELSRQVFLALENWFNDKAEELGPFRGCFFIHSAAEFRDPESEIYQRCRQHKQAMRAVIEQQLSAPDQAFSDLLCTLIEGAIVNAYIQGQTRMAKEYIAMITLASST